MEKFTFKYESYGFGSATVRISAGTQMVAFNASYIGRNPLEDILEALPEMVFDEYDHCQLHWLSEPGVLRLTIKVVNEDAYCGRIRPGHLLSKGRRSAVDEEAQNYDSSYAFG